MVQLRLKGVSINFKAFFVFERSLKGMSGKFQWCPNAVLRVFKEDSKKFQGSIKRVSKNFKGVSRKIEGCFKGVFSGFQGALKEVPREF